MKGFEIPLASWRVHATAAELHQYSGNSELADYHLAISRDTIMKLANSLLWRSHFDRYSCQLR
jgi:hypothetical protein